MKKIILLVVYSIFSFAIAQDYREWYEIEPKRTAGDQSTAKINSQFLNAVAAGNISETNYLFERGVDLRDVEYRALMYAIQNGNEETLKFLLTKGANPYVQDNMGHSPMAEAVRLGRSNVIAILKDFGPKK